MGAVADATLAAGGAATGVMPRALAADEPPHAFPLANTGSDLLIRKARRD